MKQEKTFAETLREELRDLEYAEGYAESFRNCHIAAQIVILREQRGMTQADLAKAIGSAQPAISRIEDVNYSAWSIKTLQKLANAFQCRLHVSFEPFGSLLEEVPRSNRQSLERPEHKDDPGLWPEKVAEPQ